MSVYDLLAEVRAAGGRLWLDDGKLKYRFANGTLDDGLRARLAEQKEALVACLARLAGSAPIVRARDRSAVPASFAQRAIWYFEQMRPDSSYYHIVNVLEARGDFDSAAFIQVLDRAISRHTILRTNFHEIDGEVRQIIGEGRLEDVRIHDLSDRPADEQERQWRDILRVESGRRFDLEKDLLIRVAIARFDAQRLRIAVVTHHIVSDAISMALLFEECRQDYIALHTGVASGVGEPSLDYADYAAWELEYWRNNGHQSALDYWTTKLEGAPDLALKGAKPRPRQLSMTGGKVFFELDAALTRDVQRFCEKSGVSLFSFLLSVYSLLLMRYSEQTDVVVGTVVSNRERTEVRTMQGLFINSLAHRIRLPEGASVTEHVRAVHQAVIADFRHQSLPFEKLLEKLEFERSPSRSTYYRALFILQPDHSREWDWGGSALRLLPHAAEVAFTDLKLDLQNTGGRLEGYLEYAADIFERETVERLVAHFMMLVRGCIADPHARAIAVPMLTEPEQELLESLARYRDFSLPWPTLHAAFEQRAAVDGERIALVDGTRAVSYAELNAEANRLAHHLIRAGVEPGSIVGLRLPRDRRLLCGILAVLKAGAAYLVIDPQSPSSRQDFLIADSGLRCLVSAGSAPLAAASTMVLDLDDALTHEVLARQPTSNPAVRVGPDTLAYVIYTSGSTGRPKGVLIEHRHVLSLFASCDEHYDFGRDDVWTLFHSCAFDFSVWEMWGAWMYGGRLVVVSGEIARSPDAFLDLLSEQGVTVLNQTPSAFYLIQERFVAEPRPLAVRYVIFGGEALDTSRLAPWNERLGAQCQLINMYGITETTVHVTFHRVAPTELGRNSRLIGRPRPDTGVTIKDGFGNPVPIGMPGELFVHGHGVARGYLNRPELTAERFVVDPHRGEVAYRTGDIVSVSADGNLLYHGRCDNQVKIRGYRIELEEVRACIAGIAGVAQCAVTVGEQGERAILAYVVLDQGAELQEIVRAAREQLPDYMVPAAMLSVASIPLTINGKIDYAALAAATGGRAQGVESPVVETELQRVLLEMLQPLLSAPIAESRQSLYAMGASSLTIVRFVNAINARFNIKLAILDVLTEPTIAAVAARVETLQRGERRSIPLEVAAPAPSYPLTNEQQRLWYLHSLDEASSTYNVHEALDLDGAVDPVLLERALNDVIARHEILRTRFEDRAGVPVQIIDDVRWMTLPVVDLRAAPEELERRRREDASQPFALSKEWPIRCRLYRVEDARFVLSVTLHHIACDGWSMALLVREFCLPYNAYARGQLPALPPLARQFKDYACWQHRMTAERRWQASLELFMRKLREPPVMELPYDRVMREARQGPVRRIESALSAQRKEMLASFAARNNLTPFMLSQSAFTLLLSYVCRTDDVLYGLPVVNREDGLTADLIGFFVNTLVVRSRIEVQETLSVFLRRMARELAEVLQHQATPLGEITAALAGSARERRDLYDVMLVYQNNEQPAIDLAGIRTAVLPQVQVAAMAALTLEIRETRAGLDVAWDYDTARFAETTIRALDGFFHILLDALVASAPETTVGDFLQGVCGRAAISERNCAHRMFERQVLLRGDQTALVHDGREMSYGALNGAANRLARHLRAAGIGSGDVVAIYCQRSFDAIIGMLAALKCGATYLPLEPDYPPERIALMLRKAAVRCIVSHDQVSHASLPALPIIDLSHLDTSCFASEDLAPAEAPVSIDSPMYIIFTSGTTGEPKGATITHRGLYNYLCGTQKLAQVRPGERVLQFCSLSFDASIEEIYLALLYGGALVFRNREISFGLEEFKTFVLANDIRVVSLPVAYWHMLCQELEVTNVSALKAQLRVCLLGGEAPSRNMVELWHRAMRDDVVLLNTYGPTECTVTTTIKDLTAPLVPGEPITIGHPLPHARCYVVDEREQLVADGEVGELYIGGHALALGYINDAEQTAKAFISWQGQRVYRTGDRVVREESGELRFVARADGQTKINGVRFEVAEIQQTINRLQNVHDSKVVCRDTGLTRVLAAFVIGQHLTAERIRAGLARYLPKEVIPTDIVILQRMPLNLNGKVDEKALLAILAAQRSVESPGAGSSEVFMRVSRIWAEVLSKPAGGPEDHLFLSGGTSLTVGMLLNRLRTELGVQVGLKHFMENPTLGNLATSVEVLLAAAAPDCDAALEEVEI